ncbi:MAG: DUF3050 domain-containing protein [Flavobacteriaceae bacterium]|jgi:hypothetical protein|nr:DUF3050 domain-containing protein [Candidatus Arcticimaribacter sp.]MDA9361187.1 DUF3050 domain-containing protein [Flavobacteriaceae bacterium]MDC1522886.1 DUF3050 domain-containing protein [Flavobacteriaceae bacterium]
MIDRIENEIETLKVQLINHPLYKMMKSQEDLQVFMEHHVYAVWDFMSLVKKLQVDLTTTTLPWVPPTMPSAGRLINEIVWGEETDINKDGVPMSHFEMYLESMEQVGASTSAMNHFLSTLSESSSIQQHIASAELPNYIKEFLKFTFEVIESNKTHVVAAVFTFGREDLIPDMFIEMIKNINNDSDLDLSHLIYYLERHIEVDSGEHGPMALKMIQELCGDDPVKWEEALVASKTALNHRIALWNGIADLILKPITN